MASYNNLYYAYIRGIVKCDTNDEAYFDLWIKLKGIILLRLKIDERKHNA